MAVRAATALAASRGDGKGYGTPEDVNTDGTATDLRFLPNRAGSDASDVDSHGVIVGDSTLIPTR